MSGAQDASLGIATETTWKTVATPTRWFEFVPDPSFKWNKKIVQGKGLRVGSRVARSGRRVVTYADGSGDFTVECVSKGMGLLWQACLGAGTSTLVSGSTYQQVFTIGDNPTSFTMQYTLPRINSDGTFALDPYTYSGCMVDSWELDIANEDIAQLKTTLNMADLTTATGYASPSIATQPTLFHFANGTLSTGTLTAPTSNTLASAATALADVRSATLSVNNNISTRDNLNGTARQSAKATTGEREISGKLTVEYDSTTFRDAVINDTPLSMVLNFTGAALSTGVETLQIVVPEIKLDGDLPNSNGNDLITVDLTYQGLDNLTAAQPIWVVTRTSDTAL